MTPTVATEQTGSQAFREAVYGTSPETVTTTTPAAEPSAAETASPAPEPAAAEQPAAEPVASQPDQQLETLIQQSAQRMGLDLNDPNQRKTAKSFADAQLEIARLKDQIAAKAPSEPQLTEFERAMAEAPAQEPTRVEQPLQPVAQPRTTETTTQPSSIPPYVALTQNWRDEGDAYAALNEAVEAKDPRKTWDVETAMFMMRANNLLVPMLQKHMEQFIGQQLGDVIPEVRQSVQERRSEQNREFALSELRKSMGETVDGMFNDEGGQSIKFDGKEFPNTAVNRILAKEPELLQINVLATSPESQAAARKFNITPQDAAERLTYIQRYRAIGRRVSESRGTTPQAAQQLLDAGKQAAERAQQDSIRQGLNSGTGATVTNGTPGQEDYVASMMAANRGGRKSLADLMATIK